MTSTDEHQVNDSLILQAVAKGWCSPENKHKEMDAELASAIAIEVISALAAMQAPIAVTDAGLPVVTDDQGFTLTPENAVSWLTGKYARHKEIEDLHAAILIKHYAAIQSAPIVTDAVAVKVLSGWYKLSAGTRRKFGEVPIARMRKALEAALAAPEVAP